MFLHILKLAYRSFQRHSTSFFINLIGLSTGLACTILIYLWVVDELSFDKFHENDTRLYQVMKNSTNSKGEVLTFEWTPGPLAKALKEDFPEVKYSIGVELDNQGEKGILITEEKRIKALELFAGADYFNVFSYELLEGSKGQVLNNKNAILLSDEVAIKLFGTCENIIGKSVEWEKDNSSGIYQVSGIFKSPPTHSTDQFDVIFSFEHYLDINPDVNKWTYGGPSTYIVLGKEVNPDNFNKKISSYLQEKSREDYQTLFIRKYSDRYLYGLYENGLQAGGRISYVKLFVLIAFFIILIACINFMNLTTARASRRMVEVGVKKAIGANKRVLITQYLSEAVIIAFISLAAAIAMVSFALPQFNAITEKNLTLGYGFPLFISIGTITLITGLLAGSYPAFFLSSRKPVNILKGKINNLLAEIWARKGLVIFQFTISIVLIVAVLVIYQQIQFIHSKNLGFNKDNIISFKKEGQLSDRLPAFLDEVKKISGVINASSIRNDLTNNGTSTTGVHWQGEDPDNRLSFKYLSVDYDLIETMDMEMAAGRPFSKKFGSDSLKIIFNESAIKAMGMKDPIGKTVRQWGQDKQIIGVVKDFHFESLYEEVKPCFLFLDTDETTNNLLVKIRGGSEQSTIPQLEALYKDFTEGLPFEFKFLDENYQKLYASEQKVSDLSKYFAGLAILISCLGLFGLVTFTINRKKKEIGIRKVLGASVTHIVGFLSKDFLQLVFIAILIATPIAWYLSNQWIQQFAYRIDIHWSIFILTGLVTIIIAFITVSFQSVKAALMNPVESIRNE